MSGFAFPRSARLTQKAEYDQVLRRGDVRFGRGPLSLTACRNELGRPRLGMIVPKRVVRRAVDRNRTKRAIRHSFRHVQQALPAVDIVVRVRGQGDCGDALDALWRKLGGMQLGGSEIAGKESR